MIYSNYVSEANLTFDNEISQANNLNATAHLYIQNNGLLYKKYFIFNELTKKNIDNLLLIAANKELSENKNFAFPVSIVKEGDKIIGYLMPYYKGVTMQEFIDDNNITFQNKISCFIKLADIIYSLPDGYYIGDLHLGNVIVDKDNEIHLIDIDGYSIEKGHMMECPILHLIEKDKRFKLNKYFKDGKACISRETDILCFYEALVYLILGNITFTMYSDSCFNDYLDYLSKTDFPKELLEDIKALFESKLNKINKKLLENLNFENFNKYSFIEYTKQHIQ